MSPTTTWIRGGPTAFTPPYVSTGPPYPMALCNPPTPASARARLYRSGPRCRCRGPRHGIPADLELCAFGDAASFGYDMKLIIADTKRRARVLRELFAPNDQADENANMNELADDDTNVA